MRVDLRRQLKFLEEIADTNLWPDIALKNNKTGGHSGTDSTMGGKMWGAALVQAGEISVPHFWKPVERMESLETPGGWL